MKLQRKFTSAAGCLLLGLFSAGLASPATLAGSFTSDDQMFQYTWNLAQSSNVTAYTDSYAAGGFVPVVSLFNNTTGALIAVDGGDSSCSNGRMMDSSTGLCNDAYLSASLAKGSYLVVLTEFDNFPNSANLSGGFFEAGQGNFTSAACAGTSGPFWETDLAPCAKRTGNYSLNLNLSATATPEPATVWLFVPAVAFVAFRLRGRAKRQAARLYRTY